MKLLCFGIAKDIIGQSELSIEAPSIHTVKELKQHLQSSYPEFNKYKSYMIAVNQSYASDDLKLTGDEEIAIIPPVSGG